MAFRHIVVALDGSPGADYAFNAAIDLARVEGAELLAISVAEGVPQYAGTVDEVQDFVDRSEAYFGEIQAAAKARARALAIDLRVATLTGHAAQRIVDFAQSERADLLVIGHSGHSAAWGPFMGTTADKIVRHAPCSVLVVRTPEA
jgi:nucleotide-binding universal stress UspA family protein